MTMQVRIAEDWRQQLQDEFDKPYFKQLTDFVREEYAHTRVLPPGSRIFYIFDHCPFDKVKIIILGQDPYPTPGLYYGVCFSVPEGVAIPGSLANIFREMTALVGAPFIRKYFGRLAPISAAGIGSSDILLAAITKYSGKDAIPLAILHGILINLSVPFFVSLFCNL